MKKKIIMIAGLVLLVVGATVGGLMIGRSQGAKTHKAATTVADDVKSDASGGGEKPEGEAAKEGEGAAKEGGEKSKEGGEKGKEGEAKSAAPTDVTYVFEKFTTNLSDDLSTYVQMKVEVEAASGDAKKIIEANVAPLRDATIMVLSSKTREDVQSLAGKERLKRELLVRYQGVLNSNKTLKNLYITEFTVVRY